MLRLRWRVQCERYSHVVARYRVYCRKMSVQGNWVEDRFAILNGAPTFVTQPGLLDRPHDVLLVLPKNWARSDEIRDKLSEMGVQLKDGRDPTTGKAMTTWEIKR